MAIGPLMRLPLATIAGAIIGVVCALAIGWTWHSLNPGHSDLHERLHAVVPLDDSEKQILQAKEQLFATRRGEIEARLRIANRQLADAIAADPKWNPRWNVQVVRWSGLRAISSASRSSMCSRCARA